MNITLTPELENLIRKKVESGKYNSPSEVIRDALNLLKEQDQLRELRREEVRREVMRNGEYTTISTPEEADQMIEKIKREGRKRLAERK
jgi:antitoxin ParD1/3/4